MTATIAPSQQQSQRQNRQFDTGISDGFSLKIEYRDIVNALLYHGLSTEKFAYAAADFLLQLLREQEHPEWGRLNAEDQRRYIYNTYRQIKKRYQMPFSEDVIRLKIVRPIEKSGLLLTYKPFVHPFIFNHTKAYHVDLELLQNLIKSWKNGEQCAKPTAQSVQSNRTLHSPESDGTFERSIYTINKNKKRERGRDDSFQQRDCDCKQKGSSCPSTEGIHQDKPIEDSPTNGIHERTAAKPGQSESVDSDTQNERENQKSESGSEKTPYSAPESDKNQTEDVYKLHKFSSELLNFVLPLPIVKSSEGYTAKVINNIRCGELVSCRIFNQWMNGESIASLFSHLIPEEEQDASQQASAGSKRQNSPSRQQQSSGLEKANGNNVYEEWQIAPLIKPQDEGLIEQGYQPGDVYPNFFHWVIERHSGNNQYTRQQTVTYVAKIFKFNRQAVAELWADYKQYLDVQAKQAEEAEQKGMPWSPPNDLKQHEEIPIERAQDCSRLINERLLQEQNRLEQTRQQIKAEKGQLPGAGDPQLPEQPESEERKLEEPPQENSKEAATAEQSDIETASPADSQNQETQSSPQNEGLISAQAVAEDASENTNAPAQNQEAVETKPESEEAEPNRPKIPSHLTIDALAESIENYQSNHRHQRKKTFKPHVDKLNKALKLAEQLGDETYQEQLIELVAQLPEADYRFIKMPFSLKSLPKWQEIVEQINEKQRQTQKQENQLPTQPNSSESSPESKHESNDWITQVQFAIHKHLNTSSELSIVLCVNKALEETASLYRDKILAIVREKLPNYLLNQLEVEF